MKKFLGLLLLPLGLCLAACAQEEAMPPVDDNNIVDNEVNDSIMLLMIVLPMSMTLLIKRKPVSYTHLY